MTSTRLAIFATTLAALALTGGCANQAPKASPGGAAPAPTGGRNEVINRWLTAKATDLPAADYRVNPPDKLVILAPRIKELNNTGGEVRADGKLSLNLVGEVDVAGRTPIEIGDLLVQKARRFYTGDALDITVIVTEYKSKVFYVMGQVITPGIKPYTGRDTIIKVIADAKLAADAWPQKVVIVRPNEDSGVRQRVTVDLKEMYTHGSEAQNFLVEEGDLIYVPLSPFAQFNVTFSRLLFPLTPVSQIALLSVGL